MISYYNDKKYTERLDHGGELFVTPEGWGLFYFFAGPDGRYNADTFIVDGEQIEAYIDAWKKNFAKYLQLRDIIPENGDYESEGDMGFGLYIGNYRDGVSISRRVWTKRDRLINNHDKLQVLLKDYEYCKKRGPELLRLLF